MNTTNLYELLKNVDPTHRVKFTGWEFDFRNVDWSTMMEFSQKTTSVDESTNTLFIYFKEVDDCSFNVELLKIWYNEQYELYDNIRFFFDDIELKPSFGDVGHSDKITHIDFEPIK
jgi:hypothetical protein